MVIFLGKFSTSATGKFYLRTCVPQEDIVDLWKERLAEIINEDRGCLAGSVCVGEKKTKMIKKSCSFTLCGQSSVHE